jgi:hypothetical protein
LPKLRHDAAPSKLRCLETAGKRNHAHLGIEGVDLARDELGRLLGVRVVEEVLLDLLGLRLGGHLGVGVSDWVAVG